MPVAACLLKGCEQRFDPRQARQRYCGESCRAAARKWSWWSSQLPPTAQSVNWVSRGWLYQYAGSDGTLFWNYTWHSSSG
jgi:hypothetical protein